MCHASNPQYADVHVDYVILETTLPYNLARLCYLQPMSLPFKNAINIIKGTHTCHILIEQFFNLLITMFINGKQHFNQYGRSTKSKKSPVTSGLQI